MAGTYDINTTYIIYSENIGPSFVDLVGNIYNLDTNFSNPTYTNSHPLLVPTFYIKNTTVTSDINTMTEVILGTNIEAGICYFAECSNLKSVTINYHNDRISAGAFLGCQSLTSVTIPKTIKSIEGGAFYYCSSLTTFNFDHIENIGQRAFHNCFGFTSLIFNNSYYFIQIYAFLNIPNLTSITFTNSNCVGVIQPGAFQQTGITSVKLPSNMLYTPYTSSGGGSFNDNCAVSGGKSGYGAVGTFTLTSIGKDANGFAFTATATTSATATGIDENNALCQLLSHVNSNFVAPKVGSFASTYGNNETTRHNLEFSV
uniref:Surface antigen BspA-like n=1 Tax=viral metagenome TaxID=1070528 RepID=A0A6C0EIT1_9ZZZZ